MTTLVMYMLTIFLLLDRSVASTTSKSPNKLPPGGKFVLIPTKEYARDYLVISHSGAHTREKSRDEYVKIHASVPNVTPGRTSTSHQMDMCPLTKHDICLRPSIVTSIEIGIRRFLKTNKTVDNHAPTINRQRKDEDVVLTKSTAKRIDELIGTMRDTFVDVIAERIQNGNEDTTIIVLQLFSSLLQDACFKACKRSNRDDCSNKCYLDYIVRDKNVPLMKPIVELQKEIDEKFKSFDEKFDDVRHGYAHTIGVWLWWMIITPIELLLKFSWYLTKLFLSTVKHCILWFINTKIVREMIPTMKDFLIYNKDKMVFAAKDVFSRFFKVYIPSVWVDVVDFFQQL